jgi:hypothetical protein
VGGDGSVWALGNTPVTGGYGIYHWDATTWTWAAIPGGAVRIAVDPNGYPWVVNNVGAILRWDGTTWQQLPGAARDLAISPDGTTWMIDTPLVTNRCPTTGCVAETIPSMPSAHCQPAFTSCDGNIYVWTGSAWK